MILQLDGLTLPLTLWPAAPLTDEQLERFSEDNKPYRIERTAQGEIVIMTPINTESGSQKFYVAGALSVWTEEDGTGIGFSSSTGFTLADGSVLSPDAAWLPNAA